MITLTVPDQLSCLHLRMILSTLFIVLLASSHPTLTGAEDEPGTDSWEDRLEKLRSVPQVGVSEEPVGESGSGVVVLDPEKVCRGYFPYCHRLTGHAFLIDVYGDVIHSWVYDAGGREDSGPDRLQDDYTVMLGNGDLLVMKKFMEVIRLD